VQKLASERDWRKEMRDKEKGREQGMSEDWKKPGFFKEKVCRFLAIMYK